MSKRSCIGQPVSGPVETEGDQGKKHAPLTRLQFRKKRKEVSDVSYRLFNFELQNSRYLLELDLALNKLANDFKKQTGSTNYEMMAKQLPLVTSTISDMKNSVSKTINKYIMADYLGFAEALLDSEEHECDEDGTTWRDYVGKTRHVLSSLQGFFLQHLHVIDDEMKVLHSKMKDPKVDLGPMVLANLRLIQDWFESQILSICRTLTEIIDDDKTWYG